MHEDKRDQHQINEDAEWLERIRFCKVYADDVPVEVMNRLRALDHIAIDSSKMAGPDILFVTEKGMNRLGCR